MSTNDDFGLLNQVCLELDRGLHGCSFETDNRTRLGAACLSIAAEHLRSLCLLGYHRKYASAAALMRPCFEAYVRHHWFRLCASESDIDKLRRDKLDLKVGKMARAISVYDSDLGSHISNLWEAAPQLHSLTHTGLAQIGRRLSDENGGGIGPAFSSEDVHALLENVQRLIIDVGIAQSDMVGGEAYTTLFEGQMKRLPLARELVLRHHP
jgi:Family of unknown function (DUF6988)